MVRWTRLAIGAGAAIFSALGQAEASDTPTGSGTGFFVNIDSWLVTNAQVVEGCDRVEIVGRGDAGEVKVDAANYVAALRSPGEASATIALRQAPLRVRS